MCIFYGTKLWFEETVSSEDHHSRLQESEDEGDPFLRIMDPEFGTDVEDPEKAIPDEELPLEALDINNFVQEEDFESVRTGQLNQSRL